MSAVRSLLSESTTNSSRAHATDCRQSAMFFSSFRVRMRTSSATFSSPVITCKLLLISDCQFQGTSMYAHLKGINTEQQLLKTLPLHENGVPKKTGHLAASVATSMAGLSAIFTKCSASRAVSASCANDGFALPVVGSTAVLETYTLFAAHSRRFGSTTETSGLNPIRNVPVG